MSSAPLEAARALGPLIRASAAETDAQRELPRPLFEAMADAGLFQLGLPRVIGGAEHLVVVVATTGRATSGSSRRSAGATRAPAG